MCVETYICAIAHYKLPVQNEVIAFLVFHYQDSSALKPVWLSIDLRYNYCSIKSEIKFSCSSVSQ